MEAVLFMGIERIKEINNDWIIKQKAKIKACRTNEELKDVLNSIQKQGVSFKIKTHGSLFPVSEIILFGNGIRILFPIMWHKTLRKYSDLARELNFEISDYMTNISVL